MTDSERARFAAKAVFNSLMRRPLKLDTIINRVLKQHPTILIGDIKAAIWRLVDGDTAKFKQGATETVFYKIN